MARVTERLTPNEIAALTDPATDIALSVASIWEIQIKIQLGKLSIATKLEEWIAAEVRRNGLSLVLIAEQHVFALNQLPLHHRDPFDRIIVAQAIVDDFQLITHDRAFAAYPVRIVS